MIKEFCSLIPSHNEAKTIGSIVRRLRARGIDSIVIDDGSTDDTSAIAGREGAVVITHEKNMGKGAALREGFGYVLGSRYSIAILMDGDDQHDVGDIDTLVEAMKRTGAGIVIGNRMNDTRDMPLTRKIINKIMSVLISRVCGQNIPDSQCGFRAIRKDVLSAVTLESSNYEIESELIVKAARAGFRIESVTVKTVYQNEESGINPVVDTLRFMWLMLKLLFS